MQSAVILRHPAYKGRVEYNLEMRTKEIQCASANRIDRLVQELLTSNVRLLVVAGKAWELFQRCEACPLSTLIVEYDKIQCNEVDIRGGIKERRQATRLE